MSQFAQSGSALDSAISEDADRGFLSVNQRLPLNQLQEGEVRASLNGRMEGYWRPRRGIVDRTGALVTAGSPLQSPFLLIDSSKVISAASYASNVVTITVTAHGFAVGAVGHGLVAGLSFTGTNANGVVLLTYVDANTLSFPVAGVTAVSGTGTLSQVPINDAANSNVRASCLFSDPNSGNKEYVIIALDSVAKKVDLADYSVTDIPYPTGEALNENTDMIQVFDKVMLFRDGKQAFEWFPNGRLITSAAQATNTVTMVVKDHGLLAGVTIVIDGLTGGSPAPNGSFVVSSVVDRDTFRYIPGTSQNVTFGVTVATMTDGFTLSPGGDYTQPQTFNIQAKDVEVVGGVVTATVAGNVTIRAGDFIVVRQTATPELAGMLGNEYYVTEATLTTIKWIAPVGNYNISSTDLFEFGGRFSVGGGFIHQPGAPWGVYFQRRLWVPHYYSQSGPYNSPVYVSTKITDEIAVSDILDTTTFDQIENQFRISGGTADYVVAMHGFYDDALVVLNRNSLHIIKGTLGSLLDTRVNELTSEVGCLARKSLVMRGNLMMFLSDDGVYAIEFLNDYNLRGADQPISKNIQPYIDRINVNYASEAVGVLFENRYYLAVALDSTPGANDAVGNNSILLFNFLNKGWESLDTFGDSRFLIDNFIIGSSGVRNSIYAVTSTGGLHQMESSDSSVDRLVVDAETGEVVTPTISSSLTTRGYDLGTMERKRFTDAQVVMQNLPNETGEYMISFASEDPDDAADIGTTTQFLGGTVLEANPEGETAGIRCRLAGIRGYTGTVTLTRTIGSPKVSSIKVAGSITNRQILSQK